MCLSVYAKRKSVTKRCTLIFVKYGTGFKLQTNMTDKNNIQLTFISFKEMCYCSGSRQWVEYDLDICNVYLTE